MPRICLYYCEHCREQNRSAATPSPALAKYTQGDEEAMSRHRAQAAAGILYTVPKGGVMLGTATAPQVICVSTHSTRSQPPPQGRRGPKARIEKTSEKAPVEKQYVEKLRIKCAEAALARFAAA